MEYIVSYISVGTEQWFAGHAGRSQWNDDGTWLLIRRLCDRVDVIYGITRLSRLNRYSWRPQA